MKLTKPEQAAVKTLMGLAKVWPKTLKLFSWNGSLTILKPGGGRSFERALVATIVNIPNDGGDPTCTETAR